MNAVAEKAYERKAHAQFETQPYKKVVTGGASIEAAGGVGALALAVLRLAGIIPLQFVAITAICAGVALFSAGGTIGARFSRLL
jgi:hypothetical protein